MIKRPRQIDYFRTVTRINVWEEFNSFDNEGQLGNNQSQNNQSQNNAQIATLNGEKNEKDGLIKKQEIPIIAASNIKIQNGQTPQSVTDELYKKRRIHQSNYIRIRQDQIWPLHDKYELADDDIIFFKDFNESHNFNMKEEELETLIESFEMKSGKDTIISWIDMKDFISVEFRDKYTFPNLEKIYNYWRVKRDHLKRPLLRLHWKPNFNDKDPHVAFRPRVAEKMKLRKSMKQNDTEQLVKLSALKEEMVKYKLLVQQIKLREQMKEWILESQNIAFVSEIYKVDKQMQYFFVDDVFENHKDLELKKSQMDDKIATLHKTNHQLNDQLAAYNLFPVQKKILDTSNKLIRPTGSQKNNKPQQSETPKTTEPAATAASTVTQPATTTTPTIAVTIPTGQKTEKKNGKQNIRPVVEEPSAIIPEPEVKDTKKIKVPKKVPKVKDEATADNSGKLINITIPKDTLTKITTANSNASTANNTTASSATSASNPPITISQKGATAGSATTPAAATTTATTKEQSEKTKSSSDGTTTIKVKANSKKQEKLNQEARQQKEKQENNPEPAKEASGNDLTVQIVNQGATSEASKAEKETKETSESAIPGLTLFNTDNFEFASYIASIFIEASKRQLTVEKVCNLDTKSIDRDQYHQILNNKSELATQLKKSMAKQSSSSSQQNFPNSNQKTQHLSGEYMPQNPNHHLNMVQYSQGQIPPGMAMDYQGGHLPNQRPPFVQGDQRHMQGVMHHNMPNPAQEPIHVKKKNVIPFKTRIRIGRSGLINIDRQFDDKDNYRYEDIVSKEANYHPNKVVDKILAQQHLKEKQEQQKLKVFSFTPTDRELYNKDYFQQKQMRFKALAEDNEETVFLYQGNNPASNTINSSNNITPTNSANSANSNINIYTNNSNLNSNGNNIIINNNNINPIPSTPIINGMSLSLQGTQSNQLTGQASALTNSQNLESNQMQIEESINGLMLSSSISSQQMFNNEQDIKQLRKSISMALKNYQKSKQQSALK